MIFKQLCITSVITLTAFVKVFSFDFFNKAYFIHSLLEVRAPGSLNEDMLSFSLNVRSICWVGNVHYHEFEITNMK